MKNKESKMRRRRRELSTRGSDCPLCKQEFRGCPHSIAEAQQALDRAVLRDDLAVIKRAS